MLEFKSENWKVVKFPDKNTADKFFEIVTESGDTVCIISTDFNDKANLIATAPELAEAAQKLIVEINDTVLDEMRPVWGNTQVKCIEDKRNNLKLALLKAMSMDSDKVATTQPPAPVEISEPPNAKPVETRFCAWHTKERCLFWWNALWGNHNSGTGYIGMVPYGKSKDGSSHRSNMELIDPDDCVILPFREDYTDIYLFS